MRTGGNHDPAFKVSFEFASPLTVRPKRAFVVPLSESLE